MNMKLFGRKESLQKQSNSLEEVFSNADVFNSYAIFLTDESRLILEVNEEFLNLFQYDKDEILDKPPSFLNSGLHTDSFYKQIWTTIEDGETYSNSINTRRKDGVIIRCRLKIIPVKKDSGDYIYLCLYDAIGEEKSFNLNVSESYKTLIELTEKIPDIICIKDGEGRWLLANNADLELFQLEGINYKGKTDADLAEYTHEIYKDAFLTCMETDELCWEKGTLSRSDEIIPMTSGEESVFDVFKIPVFNEDRSRKNLIVVGRDVTKHRTAVKGLENALVRAEESDRLKSTFLATMSHELRTPLNSVLGFSQLIFGEDDILEVREFARIINNNGQMLLNLIEDLFDISLIESKQMQIKKEPTDIVKLIHEVYEMFPMEISLLNKLNLDFSTQIPYTELIVITDGFRMKQILTNLLRNALKFTNEGYITIQLEVKEKDLLIAVEDSGIGIEQEKIDSMFNVFHQGEAGLNRKFGGAGIGLAISKKMAVLLGGDLKAVSEENKGSKFTLTIPFEKG